MVIELQEVRKLGYGSMHGIPMMASSPMRHHDIVHAAAVAGAAHHNAVDVHSYEPPWKALCDFALHSDLDRLHPNVPSYQSIVNQVSSLKCQPSHSGGHCLMRI